MKVGEGHCNLPGLRVKKECYSDMESNPFSENNADCEFLK